LTDAALTTQITPDPVFIVGSPRSGTTILAWSLARHSRFWTSEESDILFDLLGRGHVNKAFHKARARPGGIDWLKVHGVERKEFFGYLGLGLNALFTSRSEGRRWIDQTPRNTLMLDVLLELFPSARFVHLRRDGRRVVHSMTHFRNMLSPELDQQFVRTGRLPTWATDFRAACREWAKFVETVSWFSTRYPDRFLTVGNEELSAAPGETFGRILSFLGEADEVGPAEFFRSNRLNSSFSGTVPAGPIQSDTVGPWDAWSDEQKSIFLEEGGDTLLSCGMATEEELGPSDRHRAIFQLRAGVRAAVPLSSVALVVSGGDEILLRHGSLATWHFPQGRMGEHDRSPTNDARAVAHLEELRGAGASYLVIPRGALPWLSELKQFKTYLTDHYPRVYDEYCLIHSLSVRRHAARAAG
jgi:hypothetical protein